MAYRTSVSKKLCELGKWVRVGEIAWSGLIDGFLHFFMHFSGVSLIWVLLWFPGCSKFGGCLNLCVGWFGLKVTLILGICE